MHFITLISKIWEPGSIFPGKVQKMDDNQIKIHQPLGKLLRRASTNSMVENSEKRAIPGQNSIRCEIPS